MALILAEHPVIHTAIVPLVPAPPMPLIEPVLALIVVPVRERGAAESMPCVCVCVSFRMTDGAMAVCVCEREIERWMDDKDLDGVWT